MKEVKVVSLTLVAIFVGYMLIWGLVHSTVKPSKADPAMLQSIKGAMTDHPSTPIDKTKTWCHIQCNDIPFVGFQCWSVCVTCTTDWGGGCSLTVHY